MPPPPFAWELQSEHMYFQHTEGSFCLKYMVIRPKDMGFFYAFHSALAKYPSVLATSCFENTFERHEPLPLATCVEPLGPLGEYNVGVVHITWIDRPAQVIHLQIFLSQDSTLLGELTPLK